MTDGSPDHFTLPNRKSKLSVPCRLLDVTLRDGGFAVDFGWSERFSAKLVTCLSRLDIEAVELGYIGGLPELHGAPAAGTSADLSPETVATCARSNCGLAAMVHPSALDRIIDFGEFRAAGLDLVRFVYHESWRELLVDLVLQASQAGLRTSINVALASRYDREVLLAQVESLLGEVRPDIIYLADTCGGLFPSDVAELVTEMVSRTTSTEVGFHAHDFMSLALANSLAAANAGAVLVDGSIRGLGRSTGNLRTELWLMCCSNRGLDAAAMEGALKLVGSIPAHEQDPVFAALCGAMNLTPPEEDFLRSASKARDSDPRRVALALVAMRETIEGRQLSDDLIQDALKRSGW